MEELYQEVGCIGLREKDGSYKIGVPLYVKVTDLNKNGMSNEQETILHRISEVLMHRYEKQLSEFMGKNKGVKDDKI